MEENVICSAGSDEYSDNDDSDIELSDGPNNLREINRTTDLDLQKLTLIRNALNTDPVNTGELRQLAIRRGGLISNDIRKVAWPKLLDVDVDDIPSRPEDSEMVNHRDYRQVVLDVSRSLKRFPPGMKNEQRLVLQDQMVNLIMAVLVRHDDLYYYQGYHDICVTILLVVGDDISFLLLDKLSTRHLRGFMDPQMERTRRSLSYLYPILGRVDQQLRDYMERADLGTIFALSWLITWYGHVLGEFCHIVRLYDFFIACDPLMPIYMSAAIVLYRRDDIYSTECEMCYIHSLLSKIPDNLPYEELISKAGDLFLKFPPSLLEKEADEAFDETYTKTQAVTDKRRLALNERRQNERRRHRTKMVIFALSGVLTAIALAYWTEHFDVMWWL